MNFKCTCRMVYGDIGPRGKARSASCEMHGSVEATAKYRADIDAERLATDALIDELGRQFRENTDKMVREAMAECEQQKTSRSVFCTCAAEYPKGPCAVHAPPYATAAEVVKYLEPPIGPSRANALADRCQTLEDEKRGLEVENSRLRREVERLGRKR